MGLRKKLQHTLIPRNMDITQCSSYGCQEYYNATEGPENYPRRRKKRPTGQFHADPLHYHYELEGWEVEAQTKKAVLFLVDEGLFWCPKGLIRFADGSILSCPTSNDDIKHRADNCRGSLNGLFIHQSFYPKYLSNTQ